MVLSQLCVAYVVWLFGWILDSRRVSDHAWCLVVVGGVFRFGDFLSTLLE